MADPARYFISPLMRCETDTETGVSSNHSADLYIERHDSGHWIKSADFEDYKAAQRRNASADSVSKLGMEVVALRIRLQEMEKAGNRLAKAAKRLAKTDYEDGEGVDTLLKGWEEAKNA